MKDLNTPLLDMVNRKLVETDTDCANPFASKPVPAASSTVTSTTSSTAASATTSTAASTAASATTESSAADVQNVQPIDALQRKPVRRNDKKPEKPYRPPKEEIEL